MNSDLALAHVLADHADQISMKRFGALDLKIDTKPDPLLLVMPIPVLSKKLES